MQECSKTTFMGPDKVFTCQKYDRHNKLGNWHCFGLNNIPKISILARAVTLKIAEEGVSPVDFDGKCYMQPLRAFIDYTAILCSKENENSRVQIGLDTLME
ncbi:hypothetical protein PoB_003089500 [Plakobranchus ocellatus]|uniref:Uncharacterized protein n=1 Tax=Plakobranchus ocellatus TaxID=259542 RepID=A0AAV4A892_9GAST|nr:hypothetical protein PoB_003089500 [Plakobranchus ocellatus]